MGASGSRDADLKTAGISWYAFKVEAISSQYISSVGDVLRTSTSIVSSETKFLKYHLIASILKSRERIRGFSQNQSCLFRIAVQLCLVVEKFIFPYLLLRLPIHQISLLYWPSEHNLSKVLALFELRSNVDFSFTISRQTVRDSLAL